MDLVRLLPKELISVEQMNKIESQAKTNRARERGIL
jgi:hypothetical protein